MSKKWLPFFGMCYNKDVLGEGSNNVTYKNEQRLRELLSDVMLERNDSKKYEKKEIRLQKRQEKKQKKVRAILKNLDLEHNWSWYEEIYNRNLNNMNGKALFYRGVYMTYRELFEKADQFATTLSYLGLQKGDQVATCMTNTPELVVALLGANKIGVVLNIFGADFSPDYIEYILNRCNKKLLIASDDRYHEIQNIVGKFDIDKKLVVSLTDSLPGEIDPFDELDAPFYKFVNYAKRYAKNDSSIVLWDDFIKTGQNCVTSSTYRFEQPVAEDVFTVTYSSGSTRIGHPKAIKHRNRGPIAMARFHDKDISALPSTKNIRTLAMIPPHSYTQLTACISDTLSQQGTVLLEPIYHEDFFAYSLMINRPEFAPATRSFWVHTMKTFQQKFPTQDLSYIYIPAVIGEASSLNEEKLLNQKAKELKMGRKKFPLPILVSSYSFGGGDVEHGGLLFVLYKATFEKIFRDKEPRGLVPFALAECTVVNKRLEPCHSYELGRHMWTSVGNMIGYQDNEEATNAFFVQTPDGKTWGDAKVWGYYDKRGHIHMKGRIGDEFHLSSGIEIPAFLLADAVLLDIDNVLSCEVVNVKDLVNHTETPVVHFELQPDAKDSFDQIMDQMDARIQELFPTELASKVVYRQHDNEEEFPLTGCGKRNIPALEQEGVSERCFIPKSRKKSQKRIS